MNYDLENLLSDIKTILIANLNTKIAAVEAEKIAQGLPATGLSSIDTTHGYFEQNWSDRILTLSPALFYGVEEINAQGAGPATIETYKIFVEVILVVNGLDALGNTRLKRYTQAIKRVLQENYDRIPSASKIKIETVRPRSFILDVNTSEEMRVGGVSLTTALA